MRDRERGERERIMIEGVQEGGREKREEGKGREEEEKGGMECRMKGREGKGGE